MGGKIALNDNQAKGWNINGGVATNGAHLGIWDVSGSANESFVFDNATGAIQSMGKCVDLPGNNSANGTQLQVWDCLNNAAQVFDYPNVGGPIRHKASGKCVDLNNNSRTNGNGINIYDCNGAGNQNWNIAEVKPAPVAQTTALAPITAPTTALAPVTAPTTTPATSPTAPATSPATPATSPTTPATNNTALYVGIGVAVIIFICIVFSGCAAVMLTLKKKTS